VPLTARGEAEARGAGAALREAGLVPDVAFTSALSRAQRTLQIMAQQAEFEVPTVVSWRLNERHYGALTGLNKKET